MYKTSKHDYCHAHRYLAMMHRRVHIVSFNHQVQTAVQSTGERQEQGN